MKLGAKVVFAVSVVAVAVIGLWWLERSTRPPETSKVLSVLRSDSKNIGAPGAYVSDLTSVNEVPSGKKMGGQEEMQAAAETVLISAADILAESGDDFVTIAKKLSAIVTDPKQPIEEREEALAHTLNLSAGSEAEVLIPLVKNPQLPDELTATILDEMHNRPLGFQADLYLAAFQVHKSAEIQAKIRNHLAFLTEGKDLGADPEAWKAAIEVSRKNWAE